MEKEQTGLCPAVGQKRGKKKEAEKVKSLAYVRVFIIQSRAQTLILQATKLTTSTKGVVQQNHQYRSTLVISSDKKQNTGAHKSRNSGLSPTKSIKKIHDTCFVSTVLFFRIPYSMVKNYCFLPVCLSVTSLYLMTRDSQIGNLFCPSVTSLYIMNHVARKFFFSQSVTRLYLMNHVARQIFFLIDDVFTCFHQNKKF